MCGDTCFGTYLHVPSLALVTRSPGRRQLEKFQDKNDVPMEVYLGLLSNKTNVETISFVNGTWFDYDLTISDLCKFYSDCCPMTPARLMEQLAPGKFSCHDGFYILLTSVRSILSILG